MKTFKDLRKGDPLYIDGDEHFVKSIGGMTVDGEVVSIFIHTHQETTTFLLGKLDGPVIVFDNNKEHVTDGYSMFFSLGEQGERRLEFGARVLIIEPTEEELRKIREERDARLKDAKKFIIQSKIKDLQRTIKECQAEIEELEKSLT